MFISVHTSPVVAGELLGEAPPGADTRELSKITDELGIVLVPLFPGISDPELKKMFSAELPDEESAGAAAERLLECKAVEAAYVKPKDAEP